MKALTLIATLASTVLLFASANDIMASRRDGGRSGSGFSENDRPSDNRGSRNVATRRDNGPSMNQGRPNQGPSMNQGRPNQGPNPGQGRPNQGPSMNQGRPNQGPRAGRNGEGPRRDFQAGPAAPRRDAPRSFGGPRQEARPMGGPVVAPRREVRPMDRPYREAPRRYAEPRPMRPMGPGPDHFVPVQRGPRPIYRPYIERGVRTFYVENNPYYFYNGIYYRYVPDYGYEEIMMPENVIVSDLPYGARRVYVNDIGYYEADGMWFQPIDGDYLIVERPRITTTVVVPVPRPHFSFHASFGF